MLPKAKVVQRTRLSFFSEAQIWYSRDPDQCPIDDQFQNVIVLSDEFYREISSHPIPTDLEAVKALSDSPAVLDLSCGCLIAASSRKAMKAFRYSDRSVWLRRLALPNTRGRGGSGRTLRSGSIPSGCFGRNCPARINADGNSLRIAKEIAVLQEGGMI